MFNIKKAFTLIELLVSMSIITVILSGVLYNYGGFNDSLAVSSATQEMAITIRQAQAYGINVKESGVDSGQFNYAYGIYFNTQSPSSYVVFVDSTPTNNIYDGAAELIETVSLRNGVTLRSICDSTTCPASAVTAMSVTFIRPNPDARIYFLNGSTITSGPLTYGRVELNSPKNKRTYVIITNTGQILVQ